MSSTVELQPEIDDELVDDADDELADLLAHPCGVAADVQTCEIGDGLEPP